ncbi:unnamed protein product [Caretta caretta]
MAALGQQAVPVKCGRASSGREEPTLRAGAHWVLLQPQSWAGGGVCGPEVEDHLPQALRIRDITGSWLIPS